MKSPKALLLLILAILSGALFFMEIPLPVSAGPSPYEEILEGTVTKVESSKSDYDDGSFAIDQNLSIHITKGSLKDQDVELFNSDAQNLNAHLYAEGDDVIVQKTTNPTDGSTSFAISDYIRRPVIYWLLGLFAVVVLLVSQKQGLESLFGMAFSFLVVFKWILPLLLLGYDPVLTALSGAAIMIPITFYLSHGINKKTTLAIGGTLLALGITGILAKLFVGWSHLSGITDDAAIYLKADMGNLHFQGLLLAGIMISMLGVLDDITISQASVAHQLKETKPKIRFAELYSRTMEVGQDHIASMVNTLILIYAGASLPLLLLFLSNAHPFEEVINYEFVAQEIIQTLVASIGLILAVPLTTILASFGNTPKKHK